MENKMTLIECPRDAMQGIHTFIPTDEKAAYINKLLKVGFDILDFGSFVSPKAIPQMQDTAEVLSKLDINDNGTQLLAIIANPRGAEMAASHQQIAYLGYPFSISETFQMRNTNRSIAQAFDDLKRINEIALIGKKNLVVYLSMGFGNPYGDPWSPAHVEDWIEKLIREEIYIFSLADTVGTARAEDIRSLFSYLKNKYPSIEIGAHFHSAPDKQINKISAAYDSGCRRFDSAMLGFGGCPMAADDLTGNISTETLIRFLENKGEKLSVNKEYFMEAQEAASRLFAKYA